MSGWGGEGRGRGLYSKCLVLKRVLQKLVYGMDGWGPKWWECVLETEVRETAGRFKCGGIMNENSRGSSC